MNEHHDPFQAAPLRAGARVAHYEIIEECGRGGMGVVYKAKDLRLDRIVALKSPWASVATDELALRRFIREGKLASSLSHPNIVSIYEVFEHDDHPWMAMQLVTGGSLKDLLVRQGPQTAVKVAGYGEELAQALQYAHDQQVLHRDLNPNNILLDANSRAMITDFGLAKRLLHPDSGGEQTMPISSITVDGAVLGTLNYMSPEQSMGRPLDSRSDIFSLGAVLYEMCTGTAPFKDHTRNQVIDAIVHKEPQPISRFTYEVPPELERIVRKCMAKKADERYQEARDLIVDLRTLRRELEFKEWSQTHSRVDHEPAPPPRRWPLVAAGVLLVAAPLTVWLASRSPVPSVPTGAIRQITSAPHWEGEPTLSPDGSRVAYADKRDGNFDIQVVDIRGGKPFRLTDDPASDREPAWFPDGSAVAFTSLRSGQPSIWKVPQYGGGPTLLLENASSAAFSPDGTQLAFARAEPEGMARIWVAPVDAPQSARKLTGDGDGIWEHMRPSWSPDGSQIAYSAFDGIWTVSADGGEPRTLTEDRAFHIQPVWSPDGRFVYFSSYRDENTALWRIGVKNRLVQRVTSGTGPESYPSVSRDGKILAYSSSKTVHTLVTRDRTTGVEHTIPGSVEDLFPSISPSGDRVVFASDRWGSNFDLWVQALDEGVPVGEPERLTDHPGIASHPRFSPDGQYVAYYRILKQERDIWVVPSRGGQPVRVTTDPAHDYHPDWSTEGDLVFVSERDGSADLWRVSFRDGIVGTPEQLTSGEASDLAPVWSPDSSTIAFLRTVTNQSEIWTLRPGEEPKRVGNLAGATRIQWDPATGDLLAAGDWRGDEVVLKRISSVTGDLLDDRAQVFGEASVNVQFHLSGDGRFMAFTRGTLVGDVWIMEAEAQRF